ncbi:Mur ligase family protein, partial [Pseudomonas aeruginosa]
AVGHVLNKGLPYVSGPQWLAEHVLHGRWVLAVAGTHGKTTTTSMLAWVLEHAGMSPGFLIGGVPQNFGVSARLPLAAFATRWWNCRSMDARSGKISAWSNSRLFRIA